MTCPNFCEGIPLFRARLALALVFAAILLTNSIDAQSVQNTVELSVTDGRPVAAAVQELVSRYRYVITYEDPRRVYQDDLEDVTTQVRKDLYKYPPGKAPKVIVPSDATLTLSIPSSSVITAQDMGSILEQLMQAQASTGRGGHFRVERAGEVFHVMPTEVRDRNGNWIAQPSILDVHISLPMEDRSTGGMINAICNAVSTAVHIQVGLTFGVGGISDPSRPRPYHLGADNERARDVLMRALNLLDTSQKRTRDMDSTRFSYCAKIILQGSRWSFSSASAIPGCDITSSSTRAAIDHIPAIVGWHLPVIIWN